MTGVVTQFDEHAGLGEISSGDENYSFHCVNIADGSRTIEVGAAVSFETYEHPIGGTQAIHIVKV